MPAPKDGRPYLTKQEAEVRRVRIASLYLRSWGPTRIAKDLKMSKQHVVIELRKIRKLWRDSQIRDFDAKLSEALAKLDELEFTAWQEFEASRGERRSTRTRQRKLPGVPGPITLESLPPDAQPSILHFPNGNGRSVVPERVETEAVVALEQRTGDPRYMDQIRWCQAERNRLLGLYPDSPRQTGEEQEPVRRVVVYMEKPPAELGDGEEPEEPPPPGRGPVYDAPSRPLPPPESAEEAAE